MVALPVRGAIVLPLVVRHSRRARRFRLEVPGLRGDVQEAERIERAFLRRPGVVRAVANPSSGRVLIEYAPGARFLRDFVELPSKKRQRREKAGHFLTRLSNRTGWRERAVHRRFEKNGPALLHALSGNEVGSRLQTSLGGLTGREAQRRLQVFGPNAVRAPRSRTRLEILADQVKNLPTTLLLASAGVSSIVREFFDAGAIMTVVGLNSAIGYQIEKKNEELVASWRRLEAGEARVVRDGSLRRIAATELVLGDLLVCRAGDIVPADARVVDAHRLTCDEAPLTGESEPQAKGVEAVARDASLAEQSSMLFAGTTVAGGRGRAVVTATGPATVVAGIGRLMEAEKDSQTPLERRLERLSNQVTLVGAGAGLISTVLGLLRRRPLGDVARSGVALGVAAIPEGLPVVATAALVRSMQRMRRRGMVVRRLISAETLGAVTVICADKTGTLTKNDMHLELLEVGGRKIDPATVQAKEDDVFSDPITLTLAAAVLNSDVDVQKDSEGRRVTGSSTENALLMAAWAAGLSRSRLREEYPRRLLRERRDGVHFVISVHDSPDRGAVVFIKGAPEQVLPLCSKDLRGRLDASRRRRYLSRNAALAAEGLRVLALGWRPSPSGRGDPRHGGYTFLGFAGLRDPLRPGSDEAVRRAARSGIRTVILTGDQQRTAVAIARAVGLTGDALEGRDLLRELQRGNTEILDRISVVSRIAPADKVAIVRALRERGEVVAMAGDGVNDAPALKAADIGIAVGIRSSDLTRQAADVVLESEDLRSILAGVGEGRIVQDNLRRAIRFLLATNLSEIGLVLGANLVGARDPLNSLQLLWLNLLSDTLPALALALEPGDPDVLDRRPSGRDEPLLGKGSRPDIVRDGLLMTAAGAGGLLAGGPPLAFAVLTGLQLGYPFLCRARGAPPAGRFYGLLGSAVALQVGALGFSPLRRLLGLPARANPLEVAGFAGGFVLPWLVSQMMADDIIVRAGNGAYRQAQSLSPGNRQGAGGARKRQRLQALALSA